MSPRAPDEVAVLGCGGFVPGFADLPSFARGEADAEHASPIGSLVPLRQRRRASLLSRAFADAYGEVLEKSGLDPQTVASVFGSALGEASTMIHLLDQMWLEAGALSPMRFTTSVHNSASGMVSIATANRGLTTSLGADFDTPAMALLEGMGIVLSQRTPVIVCCADEAPPEGLVTGTGKGGWDLLAVAIAIGPRDVFRGSRSVLSGVGIEEATGSRPALTGSIARNPIAGLLDLALAIEEGASGRIRLDGGTGRGFSVRLCTAADSARLNA
jgi:hypothetical protein